MPEKRRSTTDTLSFTDVIGRLSRHEAVDGLIIIGSAHTGKLTAASDYDLVVVLSSMRVPLHVGVTAIDGRFADIVFSTTDQVQQVLDAVEPMDFAAWEGRLAAWLEAGEVVFDRHGHLQQAQAKVHSGEWIREQGENSAGAWNGVNYNLAVIRRYLRSDEPLYQKTADIRMMLFGPSDLFFNYFAARGIRWAGEKIAIRHLEEHDPGYLALFLRFLAEQNRQEKFRLYEQLAALTIEPVGELWQDGDTIMMVDASLVDDAVVTSALERQALDFWEELVDAAG